MKQEYAILTLSPDQRIRMLLAEVEAKLKEAEAIADKEGTSFEFKYGEDTKYGGYLFQAHYNGIAMESEYGDGWRTSGYDC